MYTHIFYYINIVVRYCILSQLLLKAL